MPAPRDRSREESRSTRRKDRESAPRGWSTDAKVSAGLLSVLATLCVAVVGWRFVESRYLGTTPVDAPSTEDVATALPANFRAEAIYAVPRFADGPLPAPNELSAGTTGVNVGAPSDSHGRLPSSDAAPDADAIGTPVAAARMHLPPMTEPLSEAPFERGSANVPATPREIVIREGDSFWLICERAYGSGAYFKALYRYHEASIAEPDRLPPGRTLAIPPVETLRELYPEDVPQDVADSSVARLRSYRAQRGDTALSVAETQLGDPARWTEIYRLNQRAVASPDAALPDGYELKLPAALTAERPSDLRR